MSTYKNLLNHMIGHINANQIYFGTKCVYQPNGPHHKLLYRSYRDFIVDIFGDELYDDPRYFDWLVTVIKKRKHKDIRTI